MDLIRSRARLNLSPHLIAGRGLMASGVPSWDIALLERATHLNPADIQEYFTDGRRVSFILQRRLRREVLGGNLANSEADDHDVVGEQGRKWEVRSVSAGGIYFCPSYMVGSGRHFECEGFLQKLDTIFGYAITDITMFPDVPYWLVESRVVRHWWDTRRLGTRTQIPRWRALALLQGLD